MKLSTIVPIPSIEPAMDYNSSILCMGSCFTENIGSRLIYYGFDTVINPFGIIFNPVSIAILMERAAQNLPFTDEDVEVGFSFYAHSDLNAGSSSEAVYGNLPQLSPSHYVYRPMPFPE